MILFDAANACPAPAEETVLFCLLISLLPLRKGFLVPVPAVELRFDIDEVGMVTLLLAGAMALLRGKSELDGWCEAAESASKGGVWAEGLGSSGIVGMGCGAR